MEGISPHSAGLCPLSGPLPKKDHGVKDETELDGGDGSDNDDNDENDNRPCGSILMMIFDGDR